MSVSFTLTTNERAVTRAVEKCLETALVRVALDWHGKARQAAPVDTGRLRSSIAWAAPGQAPSVTVQHPDGRTETFTPPAVEGLQAVVGTNVEYAHAVHEGLPARTVSVRAHWRTIKQAWGRPIAPRSVSVRAHTKRMPARAPKKFIETPARQNLHRYQKMVTDALNDLGGSA